MSETVCLGGRLHGRCVHMLSNSSDTSEVFDEPEYSLRTLSRQDEQGAVETRRFYVLDSITDEEAEVFAADNWMKGAILEDD